MRVRARVRACHHTCVRVRARVFVRISVLGLQTVADAVGELLLLAPQHRLGQERALRRVERLLTRQSPCQAMPMPSLRGVVVAA